MSYSLSRRLNALYFDEDSTENGCPENIEYNYVNENENLLCDICVEPYLNPVEHIDCGNEFCENCIKNLEFCPKCRGKLTFQTEDFLMRYTQKPNVRAVTSKRLLNSLNEIQVICPTCNSHVARGDLSCHIQKCPIECKLCTLKVAPISKIAHDKVCTAVNVKCTSSEVMCPWTGTRSELQSHISTCPFVQLYPILKSLLNRVEKLEQSNSEKKSSIKSDEDDDDDDDKYADLTMSDITLVMQQVNTSKKKAAEALRKNNNDIINAIMSFQKF